MNSSDSFHRHTKSRDLIVLINLLGIAFVLYCTLFNYLITSGVQLVHFCVLQLLLYLIVAGVKSNKSIRSLPAKTSWKPIIFQSVQGLVGFLFIMTALPNLSISISVAILMVASWGLLVFI